jgi:hypothetical protein
MSEIITPAEALHEGITDLVEGSECGLFEVIGVLEVIKSELTLASLAADEDEADEAEGEFESDGVVMTAPV